MRRAVADGRYAEAHRQQELIMAERRTQGWWRALDSELLVELVEKPLAQCVDAAWRAHCVEREACMFEQEGQMVDCAVEAALASILDGSDGCGNEGGGQAMDQAKAGGSLVMELFEQPLLARLRECFYMCGWRVH